jgi:hypothetical protein
VTPGSCFNAGVTSLSYQGSNEPRPAGCSSYTERKSFRPIPHNLVNVLPRGTDHLSTRLDRPVPFLGGAGSSARIASSTAVGMSPLGASAVGAGWSSVGSSVRVGRRGSSAAASTSRSETYLPPACPPFLRRKPVTVAESRTAARVGTDALDV